MVINGKNIPKTRQGYNYVWAFICQFNKIIATLPGHKGDRAPDLAKRYYHQIYRFMGIPDIWISNNAGPFVSEFLETINKLTGTKYRHKNSHYP